MIPRSWKRAIARQAPPIGAMDWTMAVPAVSTQFERYTIPICGGSFVESRPHWLPWFRSIDELDTGDPVPGT